MKKIMKKAMSLVLVLVMICVSMTAFAADADGTSENPYQLTTTSGPRFSVSVAPGATAWVQVEEDNGSTVSVDYATNSNYMLVYCRQPYYPETTSGNNTVTLTMVDGADMFSVYNPSETDYVVIYPSLTVGAAVDTSGTMDNPEEITLAANMWGGVGANVETVVAAGNQGYYYTITAPADGMISVGVNAIDAEYNYIGWMYSVNNETAGKYGDYHWSDDAEPVYYEKVEVKENDKVVVFASTYNPDDMWNNPAGTLLVEVSFDAVGSAYYPESTTTGTHDAVIAAGSQGHYYTYTATEEGTVSVTMNDASGWMYCVSNDTAAVYGDYHWFDDETVVSSEDVAVASGDVVSIMVSTYDPNSWNAPEGTVNWTLSFTAGSTGSETPGGNPGGDLGGGEDEEVNYIEDSTPLVVGDNALTVSNMYTYTVYYFEPSETGVYTLTSNDSEMGIVGYFWVNENPTADVVKENTIEWECTSVGQGIYVAVMADTNVANINIAKENLAPTEEVEWTVYDNKATLESFTFEGDGDKLTFIDIEDEVEDKAVLGDDGYYHLNSADGPILYVDLDDSTYVDLVAAMGYGQLKDIIYENDEVVSKVDYNDAFAEYLAVADADTMLYPLTEDLMNIYKNVGRTQGWYVDGGWVGSTPDAWMFACYYAEGTTGGTTTGGTTAGGTSTGGTTAGGSTSTTPSTDSPKTGDSTNVAVWAIVMVVAAGAAFVVAETKKRAR